MSEVNYIIHSSGPWKKHKYIEKRGDYYVYGKGIETVNREQQAYSDRVKEEKKAKEYEDMAKKARDDEYYLIEKNLGKDSKKNSEAIEDLHKKANFYQSESYRHNSNANKKQQEEDYYLKNERKDLYGSNPISRMTLEVINKGKDFINGLIYR
jgi:hypothetical protein